MVVLAIVDDACQAAGRNFESITNGTLRLYMRQSTGKSTDLCLHHLPNHLQTETCVELGRFSRQRDASFAKFHFTSQGVRADFKTLLKGLRNGTFLMKRTLQGLRYRDALEGGGVPPPPPSLRPATVSLTASASVNGICNRQ